MATSFEKLIEKWDPILRRAFLDSIAQLRDAAQIDQIVRMLEAGDVDGALAATNVNPVAFRSFDKAIADAYEAGGVAAGAAVPDVVQPSGLITRFLFNIRNPVAEQWLRDYSSRLVTEILNDQRIMIRQALQRGMAAGANPRTVALDLVGRIGKSGTREGGLIGLTSTQEQWVANYAGELASDTPTSALTRVLRDTRFDRTVIKAEQAGQALTQSQIDSMVTAYRNRALRYRAENIARSEAITALHEAQSQAMNQAIADGVITADTVTFIWHTAHDDRVRDSHIAMDGQQVQMGQPFVSGLGNLLEYPGDPSAPPEDTINCFPGETPVEAFGTQIGYRREYCGELVEIVTASGRSISATKNHPILTRGGWVAIGKLREGDSVICGCFGEGGRFSSHPNVKHMPSSIKQVFDSLADMRHRMRACGSPMDFHGDGSYSNVDIVGSAWDLMCGDNSSVLKHTKHFEFPCTEEVSSVCARHRSPTEIIKGSAFPLNGAMSLDDLTQPLRPTHSGPLKGLCLGSSACCDAPIAKDTPDTVSADAKFGRSIFFGITGQIKRHDAASNFFPFDGSFYDDAIRLGSGDRIVGISRRAFSGHVYNLQTKSGCYIANGIVASNCRCWRETKIDFLSGVA